MACFLHNVFISSSYLLLYLLSIILNKESRYKLINSIYCILLISSISTLIPFEYTSFFIKILNPAQFFTRNFLFPCKFLSICFSPKNVIRALVASSLDICKFSSIVSIISSFVKDLFNNFVINSSFSLIILKFETLLYFNITPFSIFFWNILNICDKQPLYCSILNFLSILF